MQTVQEWLKTNPTQQPQQSGNLQTVDQWLKTSSSDQSTQQSGVKSVKDWLITQPVSTLTPAQTVQAEKTQSFADKVKKDVIDYANESADTLRKFPDKFLHPVRSFINFADSLKSEWMAGVTKAGTPVQNGNVVTDISNLITGFAQAAFSPVSALFKAADAIPGVKQAADAINVPFKALGLGGSWVAEKIVNTIPDELVAPKTKEVIIEPLKELGGLTAQLLIGGKIMEKLGDLGKTKKKGETITAEEAKTILEQAKAELAPELAQSKEMPIPQKAMSVQEWIDAGKPKSVTEINKAEPIKMDLAPEQIKTEPTVESLKTESTPEKLNSRVYERMKNENPELTGDVKYTPMTIKEDVQRASNLLEKDKQEAFDIAMGKKASPDVTSTSVNIVMAEKALADGNIDLFNRLTKKRSLDQTRRGQEIVSEKASVSDNSVSRYVRDLIDTRLSLLGNSYLGKAVEFVKKQGPKQKATKIIDNKVNELTTKINSKKLDVKTALDLLEKLKCI